MSSFIPARIRTPEEKNRDITALIPDFPFDYGQFLSQAKKSQKPLAHIDPKNRGKRVAIIGGGIAGLVSAYEALRMGLKPVVFECTGKLGGRMDAQILGNEEVSKNTPAEMGAMRFPTSSKALFYYFEKTKMTERMADFPNPATAASSGTVIDFLGQRDYFEYESKAFPMPQKYKDLADKWQQLIDSKPFNYPAFAKLMTQGSIDQKQIKVLWNALLKNPTTGKNYDNLSFHKVLVESGWDFDTIELFGQVGFGSGGWNTDFVNSFLEILRVVYTAMDADHQLMYDGTSYLVEELFYKSPSYFDDAVGEGVDDSITVYDTTAELIDPSDILHTEVNYIAEQDGRFVVEGTYRNSDEAFSYTLDAVVYTPHVRVLQMLKGKLDHKRYKQMNDALLSKDIWEAIDYTHYMQSSKIFVQATHPFWKERDGETNHYKMSTTLSDRLTRSTYLLDYTPVDKGACVCLSYTWNDDSLKFVPFDAKERYVQTKNVLEDLYPQLNFDELFESNQLAIKSWESDPYFIGAFKNNLPGQYEYQRRLFSQFLEDDAQGNPYGFILAGDDISWTAGWAEGAVTTALNAVNKLAVIFGGGAYPDNPAPIDQWDELKPIKL